MQFAEASENLGLLHKVEAALARLEERRCGLCAVDGEPIGRQRLEAEPWAILCLVHQELEKARTGGQVVTL